MESNDSNDNDADNSNDNVSINFNWCNGSYRIKKWKFLGRKPGIVKNVLRRPTTAFDFFSYYFDLSIMEHIKEETNKYFIQSEQKKSITQQSNTKWKPPSVDDLYTVFGMTMLKAHVKKPTLNSYWSTDAFVETPIFRKYLSRDRYKMLWTYLHFNDNTLQLPQDRLHKIVPILNNFVQKSQECFHPYQNLCLDESLLLYKGRLSFKQYIPSKRNKFGVKSYMICDCKSGFVLDMIVYAGKGTLKTIDKRLGISGTIVMQLMKPFLQKGHILYLDNWYTSPSLFQRLYEKGTGAVGTARKNRKFYPNFPE